LKPVGAKYKPNESNLHKCRFFRILFTGISVTERLKVPRILWIALSVCFSTLWFRCAGSASQTPPDLSRPLADGSFPLAPIGPKSSAQKPVSQLAGPGGSFRLPPGHWVASQPAPDLAGLAQTTVIRLPDRRWRASLYATRFAKQTYTAKQMEVALGFLFQLDPKPDSAQKTSEPRPAGRPYRRVYWPATTGSAHVGIAVLDDTTLSWIHLESSDSANLGDMKAWAETAFVATDTAVETKKAAFLFSAALENTLGLKATEDSNYVAATEHYTRAFERDSMNPRYLANLAAMDQARKQTATGIQRLETRPHLFELPGGSEMYGVLGGLYEEFGDYEKARQCAIKALERDPDNREWLINLSDALWGLGEKVQSKNVLLGRYSKNPDFRLSIYLAGTYLGLEEYENARLVLEKAHTFGPPDSKSVEYMLRAFIGLKEYGSAQAYHHAVVDSIAETGMIHFLLGVSSFNLKQYRTALKEVQLALESDPTHREAQELSSQITALLGGKSNQILRTALTPLKTRLHLLEAKRRLNDSLTRLIASQFPMTLLEQHIAFTWTPGSTWRKTRHQLFYIPEGRRLLQFSELNYELNPTSMRFFVNRFRLMDSLMRPVDEAKGRDFYVTGNHNTTLHPENLLVHLPIKTHAGKHFLEVITTEESQVVTAEFPFIRFEQQAVYPIITTRFDIVQPPTNLLISPKGECRIDSLADRLSVTMEKPVLPLDKRFFSVPPEFMTGFSASAMATWREIGNGYWKTLSDAGRNPDSIPFAIRERASEVVQMRRDLMPMHALFRYVRDSVRYNNFEFSLEAQVPEGGEKILQTTQADCKGHALLLTQMLKSVGYQAYLFLIDLDHPGEPEHPSLNQFNHMIVYVPPQRGKPAHFLDATEKHLPFRESPLPHEGRLGLVVDADSSRLQTVSEVDSLGEHEALVFHSFDVHVNGSALGIDSVQLTGKLAGWFRDHYHSWNPNTRMQTLRSWMSEGYPPFVERGFSMLNIDDPDQPLTLVFKFETRFAVQKGPREVEHFPKLELSFLRFPPPEACRQPVYFANPIVIQSQWTYHLPNGYVWKSTDIDREVSATYLHWKFSIQQNVPESILIRQRWQVDPFVATPEDYSHSYTEWGPILARSGLRLQANRP
jgi:tetratricopeptide (TPR) repeat protein